MLRLTFKISRSTDLPIWPLVDKILAELNKRDLRIINSTSSIVEFNDNPWKLRWNFEAMGRLEGGKFEFSSTDNSILVTFSYYRKLLWPIVIFTALSISLLIHGDYYGPLFFLVFYVIAITVDVAMLKGNAGEMLDEILK